MARPPNRTLVEVRNALERAIRRARKSDDPHVVEVSDLLAIDIFIHLSGNADELEDPVR